MVTVVIAVGQVILVSKLVMLMREQIAAIVATITPLFRYDRL